MISVRGNWLGLGMFAIGGIVAGIGGFFLKLGDVKTMVAVGAVLVILDLAFRLTAIKKPNWLFGKQTGGFFFFVPVWLLGVFVIALNVLIGLGYIKK